MKRLKIALICASFAAASICGFTACGDNSTDDGAHSVTFIYNYVDSPAASTLTVEDGEKVTRPSDPQREDYRFKGWYTSVVCTEKFAYDFNSPVNGNLRLFAGWSLSNATVTFNLNYDGAENDTASVEVGGKVARPATDPVREDYRFDGWFTDALGTREFDFNSAIGDNTVIYAKWTQVVARVTMVHYGEVSTSSKVEIGKTATRPAQNPEREDYEFVNWYADRACTEEYDFSSPVTADTRIYAGWKLVRATVTFDLGYEGAKNESVKVEVGNAVSKPADPVRQNYEFGGWYRDDAFTAEYDFATAVTDNITVYAKWERSDVTVTFNLNYGDDEGTTSSVKYNHAVEEPKEPTRSGFVFTGWYTDKECTVWFNFNLPVTDNITVYAGWVASSNEQVTITYKLNYGENATLKETKVKIGNRLRASKPDDPSRKGYYFGGWYRDAACTMPVNVDSARATVNMELYAKWMKGYAFEAEYTNLENKPGQGTSDNTSGVGLIQTPKDVLGNGTIMGMSNGAYVGKLYYNGAFLEFKINSEEEVFNAVLMLRLTPDLRDMIFTDEDWQVVLNGERIQYGNLALTGAIEQNDYNEAGEPISGDMYKRPFENYTITTNLHLNKGVNTIRLETHNNRNHGGTFNAETPLIDCMYIYSDSVVSWAECHPENVGKTMADVDYAITYEKKGVEE